MEEFYRECIFNALIGKVKEGQSNLTLALYPFFEKIKHGLPMKIRAVDVKEK